MKKEAYYFSHDANAMDDPKCMLLIDQMGMEGYGIFWGLIERLRQEKEYKLPIFILPSLAKRWGTSTEKLQVVVSKYGLFVMDENFFFSERLRSSMIEKSLKASKNAYKRWGGNATALQLQSDGNAVAMQNDAIKVKKSKEKKRKVFTAPTLEEFKNFFKENGYLVTIAERAWNGYHVANWHKSNGEAIKNWKQTCFNVWFKSEHKETKQIKTYYNGE